MAAGNTAVGPDAVPDPAGINGSPTMIFYTLAEIGNNVIC
jgi:hypothetical protein